MMFKDVQNDVLNDTQDTQLGLPAGGVGCEDVI